MKKDTIQLGILNILLVRLNGKCSASSKCCPKIIAADIEAPHYWNCDNCAETFGFLGTALEYDFSCPCFVAPGYAILALEEEIERRS